MTQPKKVLLSWSSGKDSAWALHVLRQQTDVEVVGLMSTFNESADRACMHAVRRELVEAQARAADLPLESVFLPRPCSNEQYEEEMRQVVDRAKAQGVTHIAFGDLFLEDIRAYRIEKMAGTGVEPLFPIWTTAESTLELARQMQSAGLTAIVTCVDPKQLDESYVGRRWDPEMISELPDGVDPCGENGEFHSFCFAGPCFDEPIDVTVGEIVNRDGFVFADVLPA